MTGVAHRVHLWHGSRDLRGDPTRRPRQCSVAAAEVDATPAPPDARRGFLSSDFAKRDEFTLTFRTEQYREQLTQEDKFAKRGIELMASLGNGPSEVRRGAIASPPPGRARSRACSDRPLVA